MIAGIFFSKELLSLMGADAWSLEHGYRYTRWMLGGNFVIVLLFVINAIFRGAGDAAIAMRVLWIGNAINMILDPILIFGWGPIPALGIEGAGIATFTGRATAVAIQFWSLFKGSQHLQLRAAQVYWEGKTILNIVKTSLGGVGQMIVAMTSWIFLMRILSDISSEAVAGSTIALRIMMFTLMPAWGMSNAAATLVGQNLGAGHPDRAESSVWKIGFYNMIFLVVVSVIYFAFNERLMRIFTDDAQVISIGAEWLRILSYSYLVYGWWMVSGQAFQWSRRHKNTNKDQSCFFLVNSNPVVLFLGDQAGMAAYGSILGSIYFRNFCGPVLHYGYSQEEGGRL
jgi:putative MATE family efflux protein